MAAWLVQGSVSTDRPRQAGRQGARITQEEYAACSPKPYIVTDSEHCRALGWTYLSAHTTRR